jgi:undecaprenyl-diphosphatase
MPLLHAIVLGITQGLAEFLPISSSGHLIIVPWLFHWTELTRNPELNKTFDVALHAGTFVGAVAYFRNDLARLAGAGFSSIAKRRVETPDQKLAWLLLLSAVPGAISGVLFERVIEDNLGKPVLIAVMLAVFGLVLLAVDRLVEKREMADFGPRDAVLMGAAQALALQPGVSRSGITISMGRWLGYTRDAATRISFLMSLPIIGGAALYKGAKLFAGTGIPKGYEGAFLWGTVASGVTGFAAVWLLLRYLRTGSFKPFVIYRLAAAAFILTVAAARA